MFDYIPSDIVICDLFISFLFYINKNHNQER